MAQIARGRRTHQLDGDITVFMVGMRINKLHRPDAWVPVLAAMGPMLAELSRDPDSGLLGFRTAIGWRGPTVIQYWRSTADVYRYATNSAAKHRPAWSAFNRRARLVPGAVGLWHETYQVNRAESLYVDMPIFGLAAASTSREVPAALDKAADRLAAPAG